MTGLTYIWVHEQLWRGFARKSKYIARKNRWMSHIDIGVLLCKILEHGEAQERWTCLSRGSSLKFRTICALFFIFPKYPQLQDLKRTTSHRGIGYFLFWIITMEANKQNPLHSRHFHGLRIAPDDFHFFRNGSGRYPSVDLLGERDIRLKIGNV